MKMKNQKNSSQNLQRFHSQFLNQNYLQFSKKRNLSFGDNMNHDISLVYFSCDHQISNILKIIKSKRYLLLLKPLKKGFSIIFRWFFPLQTKCCDTDGCNGKMLDLA